MIITIQNKEGDFSQYDVEKISDVQSRLNAKTRISKVGTLDVVAEALSFASQAHRAELESILIGCSEAKLEVTKEAARNVRVVADMVLKDGNDVGILRRKLRDRS